MSVSNLIIGKGDTKGRVPIHCDDDGNLYFAAGVTVVVTPPGPGSGAAPSNYASAAKEKSAVIAVVPAILFSLTVLNTTSADVYLHLFNGVAVPASGAVPVDFAVIPATWHGGQDYGNLGREFSVGLVAAISSTAAAFTAASGNDYLLSARFTI